MSYREIKCIDRWDFGHGWHIEYSNDSQPPGLEKIFFILLNVQISPWISLQLLTLAIKQCFELKFKQTLHLFGVLGYWNIYR